MAAREDEARLASRAETGPAEKLTTVILASVEGRCLTWAGEQGQGQVTLPPLLQGYSGNGQGGGLATLAWELARPLTPQEFTYPVRVVLRILRSVEVQVPLGVSAVRDPTSSACEVTLTREGRALAEARVQWGPGVQVTESPTEDFARLAKTTAPWGTAHTAMCLGCGVRNPIGLQARFQYDDTAMWHLHRPGPALAWGAAQCYPGAMFVGLDELAWWLGALRMAEAGVTTEITITLLASQPFDEPVLFAGSRARVVSADPRDRIWRVGAWALSVRGHPLAHADVRFAGSRVYTKRVIPSFLETSPREVVQQIFPTAFEANA